MTNFNEKDIENAIVRRIISLSDDFNSDNVKVHRGATNPNAYRQQLTQDKEVLVAYYADSIGSVMVENKKLRPEIIKIAVVYFERNFSESQDIFINKNLIKDELMNFTAVLGNVNKLNVDLKIVSESRLPFLNEQIESDGFVWFLESQQLFKVQ
jgi:hypothetical protein